MLPCWDRRHIHSVGRIQKAFGPGVGIEVGVIHLRFCRPYHVAQHHLVLLRGTGSVGVDEHRVDHDAGEDIREVVVWEYDVVVAVAFPLPQAEIGSLPVDSVARFRIQQDEAVRIGSRPPGFIVARVVVHPEKYSVFVFVPDDAEPHIPQIPRPIPMRYQSLAGHLRLVHRHSDALHGFDQVVIAAVLCPWTEKQLPVTTDVNWLGIRATGTHERDCDDCDPECDGHHTAS